MQQIEATLDQLGLTVGQAIGIVVALLLVVAAAIWAGRRRSVRPQELPQVDLMLRVEQLDPQGPPASGPALELYHLPMRLAALVLAPTGRGAEPPAEDHLPAIVDQLVPGLGAVLQAQRPLVRIWPAQLSTQGFANTFFTNAPLPGDRGKGTPWCALAGRFEADGQKFLAGLVLRGAAASNLSQFVVERDSQWIDLVRVRLTRIP